MNWEQRYRNERAHVQRLTHHVGVQWGVRYPDGHIIACADKDGALFGVRDYAGLMPGGVLVCRTVTPWSDVYSDALEVLRDTESPLVPDQIKQHLGSLNLWTGDAEVAYWEARRRNPRPMGIYKDDVTEFSEGDSRDDG